MPKSVPIFQTFLLQNAKGNFYILLLYKEFYIMLDIILIHIMGICMVHINCIVLYFLKLFCSLVRDGNIKRLSFYTLQVTSVFSNFPQPRRLNKMKNDLLELEIQEIYKKPYFDYLSFCFLRLCFQILLLLQKQK